MTEAAVYLDYAASTPVDKRVWDRMIEVSGMTCANPSSTHEAGLQAQAIIAQAAGQLARLLKTDPANLVWTSGATESDNLAIVGGLRYRASKGKHIVTMKTEHKAVTDVFEMLARDGFDVSWVEPDANGRLDPQVFAAALRDETQLASIMYVNNETGVVQDIAALGSICRDNDVLFHVDAAQAVGKIHIDLQALPINLMSMTAHKCYGPKGIGALYIADRPGCHVDPLLFGGGQQGRIRPGTLPMELIAGFGMAAQIAAGRIDDDLAHLHRCRELLWNAIADLGGVMLNGDPDGFPGILNVSADGVEGESLLLALEPLLVATGSACNSQAQEPSYVLRALGRSDLQAQSAIRFSFGRPTTTAEVELAAGLYRDAVTRLRDLSPGELA
jgi:cysteine desulfurase